MTQTIKKVTKAVPKNKKCWTAVVEHLQFPSIEKIHWWFACMCFSQSRDEKKGILLGQMSTAKKW